MDKVKAQQVGAAIELAARKIAAEFGLDCAGVHRTYDAQRFTIRCEFTEGTAAQVEFESVALWYGLRPEHFGHTFEYKGTLYRISGIARRTKLPIKAVSVRHNREFRFSSAVVRRALGLPERMVRP